jgi:DNA processing protein
MQKTTQKIKDYFTVKKLNRHLKELDKMQADIHFSMQFDDLSKEEINKNNKKLMQNILEKGGLVMNEFDPNFKAAMYSFPMRNRIMAILSDAVLVIEASDKSGTLITVRLATDYNKDILTVPGNIFSKNSFGPSNLIKDGATPITCANDILHILKIKPKEEMENSENKKREILENANLTDVEKSILNLLDEQMTKDKISEKLAKYDIGEILTALTLLEWKGFVKEEVGQIRRIK